jgi:hypothetical protein
MSLQSTDRDYQTLKPGRTFEIIGIIEKIRSIIGLERLELLTLLDEASSHALPNALPVLLFTRQSFSRA